MKQLKINKYKRSSWFAFQTKSNEISANLESTNRRISVIEPVIEHLKESKRETMALNKMLF